MTTTIVNEILAARGERYGIFAEQARVAQRLKAAYRDELTQRGKVLAPDQYEALDMTMTKIARIINGDSDYADSWTDVAGFMTLVSTRLEAAEVAV